MTAKVTYFGHYLGLKKICLEVIIFLGIIAKLEYKEIDVEEEKKQEKEGYGQEQEQGEKK